MSGADHIRAALALGIEVTGAEMRQLQAATGPGPVADLLEHDLLAATAHHDLLPELRRRLAQNADRMIAAAAGLHPAAAPDLVDAVMARRDVQAALSTRPGALPHHVTVVVAGIGTSSQRRAIARATEDAELLGRLARDAEPVVRTSVATNAATPDETIAELAGDERNGVRAAVARRPSLDPAVLRLLAVDDSDLVRRSAGANRGTAPSELAQLACDASLRVRMAVAGNAEAPAELLTSMATDAEARVRARLGANHATPGATLAELARDPDDSVRLRVARNPSSEPALLIGLVGRAPDPALAANPSAPSTLLDLLADRTELLGEGVPEAQPQRSDRTVLLELARHPNCSGPLLRRLIEFGLGEPTDLASAKDRLGVVRRLATSRQLTDDTHRRFVALDDAQLRTRLAQRSERGAPPADVFEVLAADERLRIARALAANRSAPSHVRARAEARVTKAAEERRRRAQRRMVGRAKRSRTG